MPEDLRQSILSLAVSGDAEIEAMGPLDRALGLAYADAALQTIQQAGLKAVDIAAIACHGQTIRHRPEVTRAFSLQIGCAATLAERTGITTVSDFRSRDIAAAGQGAPLVPFAHQQLFASHQSNIAVINIGGIANITYLGADGEITGFDVGSGNMIMDALMLSISDAHDGFDRDGQLAASGQVCAPLLTALMAHPFLQRSPPKSTGRETFGESIVQQIRAWPAISDADRMASTCQFSVDAIAQSMQQLSHMPDFCLICGGGVRNTFLMQRLKERLHPIPVQATDAAGIPAQAVEAISFALLARQTLMGSANTCAAVTGATHDVCGGQITPGNNWQALLQHIPTWIR